jgi:hypothetical protein
LAYIEQKLDDYNRQLESADEDNKELIDQEIEKQKHRKDRYREIERQLNDADQVQVSTSDPDSRQLIIRNHITEVAYNVQTTVDEKHNLILDYKVTNTNDSKAMGNMLERAKSILLTNEFTALYDKGYHTGSELRRAHELGIEAIVAIPDIPSSSHAPDPAYNVSEFHCDPVENTYTCPQGHKLTTNGSWYRKDRRKDTIRVRHYKAPACKGCPVINQCTKNTRGRGRKHKEHIHRKTYLLVNMLIKSYYLCKKNNVLKIS